MRSSQYVILDTETTGLSPRSASLTELFATRTDAVGNVIDRFHSLINPGQHIPSFITRLTGITDDMVKDAPQPQEVMQQFHRFLREDDVVVGHNLNFDLSFLNHASSPKQQILNKQLCTMLLSRRVMSPQPLPSYRLSSLAEHFGLSSDGAHRAEIDVMMTIGVKQRLFDHLEQKGITKLDSILELQRFPLRQAARLMSGERDRSFSP